MDLLIYMDLLWISNNLMTEPKRTFFPYCTSTIIGITQLLRTCPTGAGTTRCCASQVSERVSRDRCDYRSTVIVKGQPSTSQRFTKVTTHMEYFFHFKTLLRYAVQRSSLA